MIKRNLEIETKYNAAEVSLVEFRKFCEDRKPTRYVTASGFDYFYAKPDEPASFCRHRVGADKNEFTYKQKTADNNNKIRREVNVQMLPSETQETAAALAASFGYEYNCCIFKTCFVYDFSDHTLVYYICYNTDLKELGRFLEIEAKEDHPWASQQEAWDAVSALERICKPLGVTPQGRIRRSLFEMFRQ